MKRASRLIAAVSLVALVGCVPKAEGPSPTDPPTAETTTTTPGAPVTTIGAQEGADAFRECLASEGIDIEPIPLDAQGRPRLDLVLGDVDFTDQANSAALDTCSLHLITGALDLADSPFIGSGVVEALSSFSECMRGRGVPDFPAVVRGFNGIGSPFPVEEIPYDDADLATAVEVCRSRLAPSDVR